MLIICQCGRVKKHGTWIWIANSFSDFLQKAIEGLEMKKIVHLGQEKVSITIMLDKCDRCREGGK